MIRSWLARNVFYPAHERMCGRDTLRYWRQLEDSQWLDPEQITQLQSRKLSELIVHALTQTQFYRQRLRDVGLEPHTLRGVSDLTKIPVLTKDDIRTHREEMISRAHQNELVESCTSGSTGSPLIFSIGHRRAQSDPAARRRAHRWFGIRSGDPGIYLWGSKIEVDAQDYLKSIRDWLINERLLSAFELTDAQLHRYANTFLRTQPHYMYSYCSTLWRFAKYVETQRPELKGVVKKIAIGTGEQMLPHWREDIIRALECSVVEEYGCREAGLIAHECPAESYHIMAENVVVEILDDHDQPVPIGEEGRIVVTNLEAYAMPFIRYDTGDRGALKVGGCECGVQLPMMWRPTGRSFEFMTTNDGQRVTGLSLSRDFKVVDGIQHYRIVQKSRERVEVFIVENLNYDRSSAESRLSEFIHTRLGPRTQVQFNYCSELPDHGSGKYRYVINELNQ